MDFDNKVEVVIGASRGIGRCLVELLASRGAIVVACSRTDPQFNDPRISWRKLDVCDADACQRVFDAVVANYGQVDGLTFNSGITRDAMTKKMSCEQFDAVIDTNLRGAFNVVRLFGPYMKVQGYGSIVLTSSIVAEYGNVGQTNYAASKAGLIGMAKTWAKEFGRGGVRVNAVCPGFIKTGMLSTVPQKVMDGLADKTMLSRLGMPMEVAEPIAFLLSDESSYVTGSVLDINGGMRL